MFIYVYKHLRILEGLMLHPSVAETLLYSLHCSSWLFYGAFDHRL